MLQILTFILLFSSAVFANEPVESRVKIAVIDTGLWALDPLKPFLCRAGHKSFVDNNPLEDDNLHGTNVFELISKNLDSKKHCIVVIKYYSNKSDGTLAIFIKAIQHAIDLKVQYINLSVNGQLTNVMEYQALSHALAKGIKFAVAAGNGEETPKGMVGINLTDRCAAFPACYKFNTNQENYHVVGSVKSRFSNYGTIVKYWENGNNQGFNGLSGTSQATAIHMGKWVKSENQ